MWLYHQDQTTYQCEFGLRISRFSSFRAVEALLSQDAHVVVVTLYHGCAAAFHCRLILLKQWALSKDEGNVIHLSASRFPHWKIHDCM